MQAKCHRGDAVPLSRYKLKVMHPWIRQALGLSGGALAIFHGWLFVAQAAAGRLDDPWLIFRWIAAASLVGALVAIRRRGDSWWGRKGIAIAVLAALLHGPAIAANPAADSFVLPETVAASVLQVLSDSGLAVGLLLLAAVRRAHQCGALHAWWAVTCNARPTLACGVNPQLFTRPPPHCA